MQASGTCAFYYSHVACECADGVLRIRGRVPTDRLKRILWTLIEDMEEIKDIDDQLDVISATGLSWVRPR
jgi:hypothetical protein